MRHRLRRLERVAAGCRAAQHPSQVCVLCVHATADGHPPGVHPSPARPGHVDVVFNGPAPDPAVLAGLERGGRLRPGGYKVVTLGPRPGRSSL